MQEPTFFSNLRHLPIVPSAQELVVNIPKSEEHKIPASSITMTVSSSENSSHVERAYIQLIDRDQTNLKEYAMENIGVYIYYNTKKQISAVLFVTLPTGDGPNPYKYTLEEFEKFMTLSNDIEASQAYRACAYYWTVVETGFRLLSGDFEIYLPEEEGSSGIEGLTDEEDT